MNFDSLKERDNFSKPQPASHILTGSNEQSRTGGYIERNFKKPINNTNPTSNSSTRNDRLLQQLKMDFTNTGYSSIPQIVIQNQQEEPQPPGFYTQRSLFKHNRAGNSFNPLRAMKFSKQCNQERFKFDSSSLPFIKPGAG